MNLREIIKKSIDLHFHIGPEIVPRKFNNVNQLIQSMNGRIKGIALKNHFYSTVPFIKEVKCPKNLFLIGSVVLNNSVGGLNPEAIYSASVLSNIPIIVWFPTINAKKFLDKTKFEIAPEWVNKINFKPRLAKDIKGIYIIDKNGKLNQKSIEILKVIKNTKSILATGHISAFESIKLVDKALKMGINKIIITHPIYQKINMTTVEQINLAKKGCFIESCYSMYSIDKIPIKKIAYQIKKIGPSQIILSSDVGQKFSPIPSQALFYFAKLLMREGITLDILYQMLVINTNKLVFD